MCLGDIVFDIDITVEHFIVPVSKVEVLYIIYLRLTVTCSTVLLHVGEVDTLGAGVIL